MRWAVRKMDIAYAPTQTLKGMEDCVWLDVLIADWADLNDISQLKNTIIHQTVSFGNCNLKSLNGLQQARRLVHEINDQHFPGIYLNGNTRLKSLDGLDNLEQCKKMNLRATGITFDELNTFLDRVKIDYLFVDLPKSEIKKLELNIVAATYVGSGVVD